MNPWKILNIPETKDKETIRAAYMANLAHFNPEDDPKGFQTLREAYENAVKAADASERNNSGNPKSDYELVNDFLLKAIALYNDFFKRIKEENWQELLKDEIAQRLDMEDEVSQGLLVFFSDNYHIPHQVWRLLSNHFSWEENKDKLKEVFPPEYIDYVISQVQLEYMRFNLFSDIDIKETKVYDEAINLYFRARRILDMEELDEIDLVLGKLNATAIRHPDFELLEAELARLRHENMLARAIMDVQLAKYPNHIFTIFEYAMLLQHEERYEEAVVRFTEVLSKEPTYFNAKRGVIECLLCNLQFEDAREALYKLLVDYPTSVFAMSSFGIANHELAKIYTQKYEDGDNSTETVINLIKFRLSLTNEDIDIATKLIKENPQIKNHDRYPAFLAECQMHENKFDEAISNFKLAIKKEPFYRSYGRLAAALLEAGKPREALMYIKEGLLLPKDEPVNDRAPANDRANHARLYQFRGQALHNLKDFAGALDAYAIANQIQPYLARLNLDIAMVHKDCRRLAEAMDYLEKAMTTMPYDPDPYFSAMEIFYEADRYDDVLAIAERARKNDAEHTKISYYKACALRLLGKADEAFPILLELTECNIKEENGIDINIVLSEIAFLYWGQKNSEKAEEYIKKAIENDPNCHYPHWRNLHTDIQEVMVLNLITSDCHKEAMDILNKAIEANPGRATMYAQRASLHLFYNNPSKALNDLILSVKDIDNHDESLNVSEILTWIGDIYAMCNNNPSEAINYYKEALNYEPTNQKAISGLADITLCCYSNHKDALISYTNLINNNPSEEDPNHILYTLGCAHCFKALKKEFTARRYYRKAAKLAKKQLETDPNSIILLAALGEAHYGLRQYAKAKVYVKSAILNLEETQGTQLIPISFSLFHSEMQNKT